MVNMRPFNELELKNIKFLVNHHINFTQVQITPTGLKKSILDATAPMRAYFLEYSIHDYSKQAQGPENKCFVKTKILTTKQAIETKTSLYRPITKSGDPRLWIYGITNHSSGDDIHVLFWHLQELFSINISKIDIEECFNSKDANPIRETITEIYSSSQNIASELLKKFKSVSGEWFKSEISEDTGIGRSIESFLDIPMNSNKTPDYKGIEIKSYRDKRKSNRNVLFTQVPDWNISNMKSGREIVDKYGYINSAGHKTYQSTVSSSPNKQNLFLSIDKILEYLQLQANEKVIEDVVVWKLITLHKRLLVKHHETFWIKVESYKDQSGAEFFRYKEIEHTYNPNVGIFDSLIEQGMITLDLLLCRPSGRGDNYAFKISKQGMPLLFPESKIYVI